MRFLLKITLGFPENLVCVLCKLFIICVVGAYVVMRWLLSINASYSIFALAVRSCAVFAV